jgi:uncharacterized protein Yka (UPF0111/DUF47 family)
MGLVMRVKSSIYKTNLSEGRRLNEDFFISLISRNVKKFDNADRALIVMSRKAYGSVLGLMREILNFGSEELNEHAVKLYRLVRDELRKNFDVKSLALVRNWKKANQRMQGIIKLNKNVLEALDGLRIQIQELIRKEHFTVSSQIGKPSVIWLGIYERQGLDSILELVNQLIDTEENLIDLDTKVLKRYHEQYYNDLLEAKTALVERVESAKRAMKEMIPRMAEERRPSALHELKHEIWVVENEIAVIEAELRTLR